MLLQALSVALAAALPGADASAPPVLALRTAPWATHSELVELTQAGDPTPRARFTHLANAAVRGAMVPGTGAVAAIADTAARRDLSFAASLFVLEPGAPARRLCDEVLHASRPLVSPDGRVFVVRGAAGPEPAAGPGQGTELRADFLRIDEVDLHTGVARTQHQFTGQLLHLAGWHAGALLVYRIDGPAADLVAVEPGPRPSVRPLLADLPPYARDFSLDAARGELVFLDRDEADPRRWHAHALDLASAGLRSLHASDSVRVGPFAGPGGAVHVTGPDGALARIRGAGPDPHGPCAELSAAGGEARGCADVLRLASADGRWSAGLHHRPGALPRPFVLEASTGRATLLPPASAWVDLLGFAEVRP